MSDPITSNVTLNTVSLREILGIETDNAINSEYNLSIPDYQRIYCWEEKTVLKLIDDIKNFSEKKYHLGNIILHKRKENQYDIVDGQQRLVTLSLLLLQIGGYKKDFSLLNSAFNSELAVEYLSYNKWLIENHKDNENLTDKTDQILNNLQFSVLTIEDQTIDLAYTFFSNQNSRGKSLTDYDLLKAHHLRFIHIPEQANHMAERWDDLILNFDNDSTDKDLGRTFEIYLFRLRKWMRKKDWNNDQKFKVKNEFEASPIISEIPPFGEQFRFNESIQGGSHFFAYTDFFIYKFKTFSETLEYKTLHDNLCHESHWWYRDAIEAFLFAYYLKFGTLYMSDALIGIIKIMSKHRYENNRAYLHSILKFASNSEIIMMIEQATSPTFFLAEMLEQIKTLHYGTSFPGIKGRYQDKTKNIIEKLKKNTIVKYN
ncbi:DUF262 domain-containing protein [Flavobacterium sp. HJSW_4]|uniref:DUF262 domain-containing protein n=1 Tax=Flavobacterium sp. HJSW_4 TaxID=3344660 RepID=UPI0035F4A6CE